MLGVGNYAAEAFVHLMHSSFLMKFSARSLLHEMQRAARYDGSPGFDTM